MPFIEWDESLATGVQQFDVDHRHLLGLLNKTYDDFICAAPDDSIGVILNELVGYAEYHFAAEETWMREISYPKLAEHKHEHDSFRQNVLELQNGFQSGKERLALDVLTLLKKWIKNHLLECDAGYVQFISGRNAR